MLFLSEYFVLFIYLFFIFIVILFLLFASFFLVKQNPQAEKLSAYECGFNPYDDARLRFEVRFFLVGILFIIFDLEIALLLPFIVLTNSLFFSGLIFFFFFFFFFIFSFFFEWNAGALEWI